MPPAYVKHYVQRQKNDAPDADATGEFALAPYRVGLRVGAEAMSETGKC